MKYSIMQQIMYIYKGMQKKTNKRNGNISIYCIVLYKKSLFLELGIDFLKKQMYNTFINIQAYTRCHIVHIR